MSARTTIRQVTQIKPSDTYTDNTGSGSTMESAPTSVEDDLNNLRSQVNRVLDATMGSNWYDDAATVNSKKRSVKQLNTDLDDLEEKRLMCGVQDLDNLTVPAYVYATGSITTVAGSLIVDGETFIIDDGENPAVTFEFDSDASVVETGTLRGVTFAGGDTADDIRDAIITAVTGASATLAVNATSGGAATVTLTAAHAGTHSNNTVTETVTDAGFVVTGLTGGAGDVLVLTVAAGAPSDVAAVGNGTDLGAICAALAGDVGSWDSATVTPGSASKMWKNTVLVRQHDIHEGITSDSRQVYGLLQSESGVVSGDTFNDTDKQCQLSFYVINDDDTIRPCDALDIGGKVIEIVYPKRITLDTLPEDCNYPNITFTDSAASVSVTLNNAIDNQGVTPATQDTNIDIDMTTAGVEWTWRDDALQDLFAIIEGSAGGTTEVKIYSDTDVFNVDAVENDFANGLKTDTTGQEIDIGVTSGTIESTGSNDIRIFGAGEFLLDDGNQTGSSWSQTTGIKLSETQAEWNTFESEFGEVSLLNAIAQAKNTGGLTHTIVYAVVTSNIAANTDAEGPSGANNLDTDLTTMAGLTFVSQVKTYVNGLLLRPGADASANNDVYPGSTDTSLRFEFNLVGVGSRPDVITQEIHGTV